jgi:ParB-like chromosome segregation protein Spo0J
MEELIGLELIDPNPYQTRDGEDKEHVAKIAASILANGLMQLPAGRRVNGRVQLAFGNTRKAAFVLIHEVMTALVSGKTIDFEDESPMAVVVARADAALEKGQAYGKMPVILRELTDEEMFQWGVRENSDRKDISPMEEARAMKRYRDEFGKTSAQIGELFGLSDATVRGKLRLLNLPGDLQQQLAGVSELVLREVLYMLELPEEYRARAEQHYEMFIKPSVIIGAAIRGENANLIADRVARLVQYWGTELNGDWKHDRADWPESEEILGACKGCAFRRQRDGKQLCLKRDCFDKKKRVLQREYLAEASKACGLPVLESDKESGSLSTFGYGDAKKLETALSVGCENLRLHYDPYSSGREASSHPGRVKGFPRAEVICSKRNGFCTCQKALSAGVDLAKIAEEKQQAQSPTITTGGEEEQSAAAPVLTADDLKEVSRAATRQKRQNAEEVKAMREETARRIATALMSDNPAVWLRVLQRYEWGLANKHQRKDWQDNWHGYAEEMRLVIAKKITEQIYDTSYSEPVPTRALSLFNDFLKEARLSILEPVEDLDGEQA